MRWEELTSDQFAQAVMDCERTCVISLGVIERHGPHLPLGTDMLNGLRLCELVARREPVVIFPPWFLGQIYEANCFPGTIAIPPEALLAVTGQILDEIARNGFTKIIAYVAHGGNAHFANFLTQCQLSEEKPYQLYVYRWSAGFTDAERAAWSEVQQAPGGGHADEAETSVMLAHRPDLVDMDRADQIGERRGRMDHVKVGLNGFWWYADYPEHLAGDPRAASAETGEKLLEIQAGAMTRFVRAVKDDKVTAELAAEFFQRQRQLRD